MRPESIRWFERVYVGRIVLSLALGIYGWRWLHSLNDTPALHMSISLRIVGTAAGLLLNMLLLYLIARRAGVIAKWIFVVFAVLLVIPVIQTVIAPNFLPAALKMGPLFGVGLDFTMVMLLFQPDSRAWFERRGMPEEDYGDTFS
jgi:hypothetical protein